MIVDAHIHIFGTEIRSRTLLARMDEAGVDRVGLLSEPPEGFTAGGRAEPWEERLSRLMEWRSESDRFYPLFWIDPTAGNAREQVTRAVEAGVSGFKIIADHFYPGAPEAMSTYQDIAAAGKPILFHSGILWDGKVSSQYNRPVAFEPLIRVPRLRFALAHVSWPWHDECLALYGKFAAARKQRGEEVPEMFIDLTPGTPPIFRQEVLTKLCTIDYDIMGNLVFGTDTMALDYDVAWANSWIERDARILTDLEIPQHLQEAVMGGNFLRFLGE
jgi:predicted TIM-barrel fold metal-dependent hydrolase